MDVNHCSIQTIMKGGVKYKTNSYQFEISSSSGSRELQNFYMIILHKLFIYLKHIDYNKMSKCAIQSTIRLRFELM
jgi:hypothetical protein